MHTPSHRRVASFGDSYKNIAESRGSLSGSGKKVKADPIDTQFEPKTRPTPYVQGVKNQQFNNPSYISDNSLSNPNYPDPNRLQKGEPMYSPMRKKKDIAIKVGSPDHAKILSGDTLTPQKGAGTRVQRDRDWTPQPSRKLFFDGPETKDNGNLRLKLSQTPSRSQERPVSSGSMSERGSIRGKETFEPKRELTPDNKGANRWGSRQVNNSLANYTSAPVLDKPQALRSPGLPTIKESDAEFRAAPNNKTKSPLRQERPAETFYNDDFTKPFSMNSLESPNSLYLMKKRKQDVAPKVTEQSYDLHAIEGSRYKSPTSKMAQREDKFPNDTASVGGKDTDSHSSKSDALLCDTCINDLLSRKRVGIHDAHTLADQELYRMTNQNVQRMGAEQELKQREIEAKKREVANENKRLIEENRWKNRDAKSREKDSYNRQLEEAERARIDPAEMIAEKNKNYRNDLLNQMNYQQQRKNARKEADKAACDTGLRIEGGGRRDLSQGDLRSDLLNQMQDRADQKNLDKLQNDRNEKKRLDDKMARDNEAQRLAGEKEREKKEEYRRALQEDMEAKRRAKENQKQSKLRDRDAVDNSADKHREAQEEASKNKRNQQENLRQELLGQIQNKGKSASPDKRIEEEEVNLMSNIGARPNREKEKMSQYREELMDQMNDARDRKLRDKMSSREGGTGLDVGSGYRNNRVPSQREVNEYLLNQMTEKEMDNATKKAEENEKMMENLRNRMEKEDEAMRRKADAEKAKKDDLKNSLLDAMDQKQRAKGDNRRQKEKDKQSLDEAADARRVEEEDMVIQKRSDQANFREALLDQMENGRSNRRQEREKQREHQDQYVLEQTQELDRMQRENRDKQIQYRQAIVDNMRFPGSNDKDKLQMKNEREPSPFEKNHGYINSKILSPNRVREELLEQMNEKKLNDWSVNEKGKAAQRELLEQKAAEEEEANRRKIEREREKKKDMRDALLDAMERRQIEEEETWTNKGREGEAIRDAAERKKEEELLEKQARDEAKRQERADLADQIHRNKTRKELEKRSEREQEREYLENSMSFSPQRRGEREKKNQYREDLLNQMQENQLNRERQPEEGNTGLMIGGNYRNDRVSSPNDVRNTLVNQMTSKRLEKEDEREREKNQFNKNLEELAAREEEANKRLLEKERLRREENRQGFAGHWADKDDKKDAQRKQKELEKKGIDDSANGFAKKRKDSYTKLHEKKKEHVEALKNQMLEKQYSKQNEMDRKKAPYLASLPVGSHDPQLADCDCCHKTYPRTRLTHKKSLRI